MPKSETPERAIKRRAPGRIWLQWSGDHAIETTWCVDRQDIDDVEYVRSSKIRSAVAAETDRCAKINPIFAVDCPVCPASANYPCYDDCTDTNCDPHAERWRAAIRAEPKEETEP
jgi:hypothetical protein